MNTCQKTGELAEKDAAGLLNLRQLKDSHGVSTASN
jgi:hypothetical protein